MTSLKPDTIIITAPSGNALGTKADEIIVRKITCSDIVINDTLNGQPISGTIMFTNSAQIVNNKSFIDNTNSFLSAANSRVIISANGAAGTSSTIRFNQTVSRTYDVPDSGLNCNFVMTEGAQLINGTKTFTDLVLLTLNIDTINEATANNGVVVDRIRLREDTLVAPAITLAGVTAAGPAADITMQIGPKGLGALVFSRPDNTATGGNARGVNAVDLQSVRTGATQVASGTRAGILCGENNTASGGFSAVLGGSTNTASGLSSFCIGSQCDATDYGFAAGRRAKSVHTGAFVLADSTNADFSSTAADQLSLRFAGGYRFSGGSFSIGTTNRYTGTATTVNAVTADPVTITTSQSCILYNVFVAGATAAGNTVVFKRSVKVKNIAGVLTIGTGFDDWIDADAALAATTLTFVAAGANFIVRVTGVAAQTINWSAAVDELVVSF